MKRPETAKEALSRLFVWLLREGVPITTIEKATMQAWLQHHDRADFAAWSDKLAEDLLANVK